MMNLDPKPMLDAHKPLTEAMEAALRSLRELTGNRSSSTQFAETIRDVGVFGDLVAAQHFRNLLLARSNSRSARKMERLPGLNLSAAHREGLERIVNDLDAAIAEHLKEEAARYGLRPASDLRRVLLLIGHLPPITWMGAHTRQICSYAAALAMSPDTEALRVVATQESAPENFLFMESEVERNDVAGWRMELDSVAGGTCPKVEFVTPDRLGRVRPYEASLKAACEFRPDVVLAFQGNYASRVLPKVLHAYVPIVAVQFNQINPEPSYADLVLAHGLRHSFKDKPTPEIWRDHRIPLVPFAKKLSTSQEDLVPQAQLRLITALSMGRLERTLLLNEAADLRLVISFLERWPDAAWLLVGIAEPEQYRATLDPPLPESVRDRVRFMRPVPDLRAIYEHCHIYMHLPAMAGGGMGMAMAIAEGIPVLAKHGTDAANFIDEDLLYRDSAEAWERVERWAGDELLRRHVVERQQRRLDRDHSLNAVSHSIRSVIAEALERFHHTDEIERDRRRMSDESSLPTGEFSAS